MAHHTKLAAAVFGDDSKPNTPEWKQIQEREAARRQVLLATQRDARLARDAAGTSSHAKDESQPAARSRRRKMGHSAT